MERRRRENGRGGERETGKEGKDGWRGEGGVQREAASEIFFSFLSACRLSRTGAMGPWIAEVTIVLHT